MSFAIAAVYKNRELYLATDSKITGVTPAGDQEDADKIIRVSPTTAIALTGNVGLATTVAEVFRAKYNAQWTYQRCVDELAKLMPVCYRAYVQKCGVEGECVLLLGNAAGAAPKTAALLLSRGQVKVNATSMCAGQYLFQIANPRDVSFETCRQLCSQHFELAGQSSPEQSLRELVVIISQNSKLSNDQANIWKGRKLVQRWNR